VGLGTGLDDVEKRKILPVSGLELGPLAVQPVASRSLNYISFLLLLPTVIHFRAFSS
jgi:hypothetical protein